jgi:MoaD family protein
MIEDILQALITRFGTDVENLIMDEDKVSGNLIIMLNMKDINTMQGLQTPVREGDEIVVLPHVQGG